MKKRLIAVALAAVLVFNLGMQQRAQAEAATVAVGAGLAILAANLIGLMTGQYDETAEAIGIIIEEGVEGLQNAADQFGGLWMSGFNIILDSVTSMFDAGEISLDGTEFQLKYSQYLEMCGAVGELITPTVELGTDIQYKMISAPFDTVLLASDQPLLIQNEELELGYIPVYYSDSMIYFSEEGFYSILGYANSGWNVGWRCYNMTFHVYEDMSDGGGLSQSTWGYGSDCSSAYADLAFKFLYKTDENVFYYTNRMNADRTSNVDFWFAFDGTEFSIIQPTELITAGLSTGYIICRGEPDDFLRSIASYTAVRGEEIDDLSEALDPVLDKTSDPSLLIDTNPAIVNPVDSVTVSDIPGEKDVNLSNLKEKTRTDLDMPSILAKKFPFCLPYDFIRIIGVLAAPAKAPVFRIPLSTDPAILEQFEGNETIGQLPEDFEPMFEIDEEIVIDLSHIPLIQPVCNTIFILGFVVLLIYLTPKMIQH
ncbi:MAG: hypothetical protein IJO91_08435 [Oscillospiraceae bacterium]|nr:hypothetical protein [Oscillospiraceae bacterium]